MLRVFRSAEQMIEIASIPQSSIGAPIPTVLASEGKVLISFALEDIQLSQNESSENFNRKSTKNTRIAVIEFACPSMHIFGLPGDEAISGHPLAKHGLKPYSYFEVMGSS